MTTEVSGNQERRIVVGVDGSASSKAALAWAVEQAHRTGAIVEAVTAWDFPLSYGYAAPPVDFDWEETAEKVLDPKLPSNDLMNR